MPRLPALALAALALVPAAAQAQAPEDARPVVVVVDPGRARVSSDRFLRVIAAATGRDVVRITDARAADPAGTLTIAYEGSGGWLVRFDSRGHTAVTHERIRPGALDASIASAALRVIGDVDAAAAGPAIPAPAPLAAPEPTHDDRVLYVWVDEILDPFATLPPPAPRAVVTYSEVLDPFGPATARRAGWTEVIDPWDR